MDHVVLVDFEGFIKLTEDLGGVTVNNKTAFSSHGFDYPKGKITIKGERGAVVRPRAASACPAVTSTGPRTSATVIKAIVEKGLSAEVVADPATFTKLHRQRGQEPHRRQQPVRRRDPATPPSRCGCSRTNIELMQAPLSGFGTSPDGQSIDIVDQAQLDELSQGAEERHMVAYLEKYPKK